MNQNPKTEDTVQEIVDIVSNKRFSASMELLEMRYLIGEALVASPLWKGNRGQILAKVEARVGLGERSLRYCAEFKEKYKTWEDVMSYADAGHKLPAWREIVKGLPSGKHEEIEPETRCKKCKIHCHDE